MSKQELTPENIAESLLHLRSLEVTDKTFLDVTEALVKNYGRQEAEKAKE